MKFFSSFIFFQIIVSQLFSQELDSIKTIKYFDSDQIIYELANNYWLNSPTGVKINDISLSSNASLMFPLIGKHTHISFAAGFGVGSSTNRYNARLLDSLDYTKVVPLPDTIKHSYNKLVTTYLEIPLELRFMTNPNKRNRSFKISVGGKFGYLVGKHLKYNGDDYFFNSGENIKIKWYKVKNINAIKYGLTARIGYGKFALSGYYSLSNLFTDGHGPEVQPYTLGISIMLF